MAIIRARLYQLEVAHPVAKSSDRISYFNRNVGKALLAFVAIQPNTAIIIYPGSHRIHEGLKEDYPPQRYA